jgi:hypothetical protein
MSWTTTQRDKGTSNKDWFEREFPSILILDCSTKRNVFYAACSPRTDPETVFALVCLTNWAPNDQFNFGYKDQDEQMGPCDVDCPERILDLLTPTEHENSLAWRASCRKRNAVRAAKPKVKKGDCVRFALPIRFSNGAELGTLRFESRNTFVSTDGFDQRYKVSGWRERGYEVVAA